MAGGATAATGIGVQAFRGTPKAWQKDMKTYFDMPTTSEEARAKGKITREAYRTKYPEVDAKLFLAGQVESLKTDKARSLVVPLMGRAGLRGKDLLNIKEEKNESLKRTNLRAQLKAARP